jgi:hypothetical protein
MGLCSSLLAHVSKPETIKDLHKIVCDPNTVLDPLSAVKKVAEEISEVPGVVEIREVVNNVVDKVVDNVDKIVDTLDDIPELIQTEIKDLDISLNKLNRKIFNE